jgi:hypothetical protein
MVQCGLSTGMAAYFEGAEAWPGRLGQEISMNARKNAAAPDRRKTEDSTEESRENAVPASLADAAAARPVGSVTAFPQPNPGGLSNRALNVLKMLSAELMGECPPREAWTPSAVLLRRVTFKHLSTARNCGPQTIHEIIQWAASLGVTIRPPSLAGRSLSATWKELGTRFAAGELPYADMAEALEKSVRRKSTTIPVGIQKILLQFLNTAGKPSRT